jgi:drug/metabolite transporter (DMT)-like permease
MYTNNDKFSVTWPQSSAGTPLALRRWREMRTITQLALTESWVKDEVPPHLQRCAFLGTLGGSNRRSALPGMGQLTTEVIAQSSASPERMRALQRLGILCGITAGAWLGAAEVPTKLVSAGLSPFLISFLMVVGVFIGRWSLPAIVHGTSNVGTDVGNAPHLIIWAILAGCLWSVANTLTVFAIRDLGLSIAFPLWNTNALIGIGWGILFFHELKRAGWRRWAAVGGGAALMFIGGMILARISVHQIAARDASKGITAALGAGLLWGTMYIPYRKAYLSGMNPLSFVSFFTVGELGMMTVLAVHYVGGIAPLMQQVIRAYHFIFWLLAAGFVWVLGDLAQQYAVKYVGVSRGIPISNSNQLWGLIWGAVAFGEMRAWGHAATAGVIYGSLLMAAGLVAISFSVAGESEQAKWRQAANREQVRYNLDADLVSFSLQGKSARPRASKRWLDWLLVLMATAVFAWTGSVARWPGFNLNWPAVYLLISIALLLLAATAISLGKITKFN